MKQKLCDCINNPNIKGEREANSARLRNIGQPLVDEMRELGLNAFMVGSTVKNLALPTSDVDIWVVDDSLEKQKIFEQYCERKGFKYVKNLGKQGIEILKYDASIITNNRTKVEIAFHKEEWCADSTYEMFKSKNFSDELLDTIYCTNKIFRLEHGIKRKVINTYDYFDYPLQKKNWHPFDVKIKK